ncbi:hypothetical protein MJM43_28905, partial [Salmonella enterica subsp. enterica serovar Montevideo]|nr:hypothetical protein [Salmonella enterica subsp. enterica serovar Montevideo]
IGYYPKINQLISGLAHHYIHNSELQTLNDIASEIERLGMLCETLDIPDCRLSIPDCSGIKRGCI